VLPSDAADIYGAASSEVRWVKMDHCQFLDWESIPTRPTRFPEPLIIQGRRRRRAGPTCFGVYEGDGGKGVADCIVC